MKIEIINPLNILDENLNTIVTRVKLFILNDKNEFIVASARTGYQLPGGHVEDGEDLTSSVIREIQEETGMMLSKNEIPKPFFCIKRYRKDDDTTNKLSSIFYYFIQTDKKPNLNNLNLTENEKEGNFTLAYIPYESFRNELINITETNEFEFNKIIANEILHAFDVLTEK